MHFAPSCIILDELTYKGGKDIVSNLEAQAVFLSTAQSGRINRLGFKEAERKNM